MYAEEIWPAPSTDSTVSFFDLAKEQVPQPEIDEIDYCRVWSPTKSYMHPRDYYDLLVLYEKTVLTFEEWLAQTPREEEEEGGCGDS